MGLVRYFGDGFCIQQRLFECLDSTDIRLRRTLLDRSVRNYRRFTQLPRPVTLYRSRSTIRLWKGECDFRSMPLTVTHVR